MKIDDAIPPIVNSRKQSENQQPQESVNAVKIDKRGKHPNSLKNLAPWPKGRSGNPGGEPGYDVAAWLCRKVIEENLRTTYKGLAKQLGKGNGYVLNVMADRGYGKLKETKEVFHKYQEMADKDLDERIADILRETGLAAQVEEVGAVGVAAGAEKANGHAQDSAILPGNGAAKTGTLS